MYAQQVINCESDIGGNEIDYNLDVRCLFVVNFMKLNTFKFFFCKIVKSYRLDIIKSSHHHHQQHCCGQNKFVDLQLQMKVPAFSCTFHFQYESFVMITKTQGGSSSMDSMSRNKKCFVRRNKRIENIEVFSMAIIFLMQRFHLELMLSACYQPADFQFLLI